MNNSGASESQLEKTFDDDEIFFGPVSSKETKKIEELRQWKKQNLNETELAK